MRRLIAFGLAVWLVTANLLAFPTQPVSAQDESTLGDAPYLTDGMVVAASGDDIVQSASVPAVDISSRSSAASFYFSYYTAQPAIDWTGSQSSCTAGTTSAAFKAAVIDRVAFFRAMAGVPSNIGLAASSSVSNQQAALMFSRNNQISHSPPSSWACYTSSGAQAAGSSNIALGVYGLAAINAYMKDAGGNNTAAGHRRWLLYPQTQSFGTGDVPAVGGYSAANSLWVWDSNINGPRPSTRDGYVAWPPPGYVPYQVVYPRWSFSYPNANFGGASVTVTLDGASVPVSIDSSTSNGYGENTIVFRPNGMADSGVWANPGTDKTYTVRISGVSVDGSSRTFTYNVTVFDPSSADPGPATGTPTRTSIPSPTPTRTATRTGTAAASATPSTGTRTPTTIPGGYAIGEQFRLTTSLNLRGGPGTSYSTIAVMPTGAVGTVTGSPVFANGYTFYPVAVPGFSPGWAAGEYFARVATTPTQTATAGVPTTTRTPTTIAPSATRTPTTVAQGDCHSRPRRISHWRHRAHDGIGQLPIWPIHLVQCHNRRFLQHRRNDRRSRSSQRALHVLSGHDSWSRHWLDRGVVPSADLNWQSDSNRDQWISNWRHGLHPRQSQHPHRPRNRVHVARRRAQGNRGHRNRRMGPEWVGYLVPARRRRHRRGLGIGHLSFSRPDRPGSPDSEHSGFSPGRTGQSDCDASYGGTVARANLDSHGSSSE